MKYLGTGVVCPVCGFPRRDVSFMGEGVYSRVWLTCPCSFSGWVYLRQDWYDLHQQEALK